MNDMDLDRHLRCKIADLTEECKTLRAALAQSCDEHRSQIYDSGPGGGCALLADAVASERGRWRRIAEAAQAVTFWSQDTGEDFIVPSHLMAALALALDEGPNVEAKRALPGKD